MAAQRSPTRWWASVAAAAVIGGAGAYLHHHYASAPADMLPAAGPTAAKSPSASWSGRADGDALAPARRGIRVAATSSPAAPTPDTARSAAAARLAAAESGAEGSAPVALPAFFARALAGGRPPEAGELAEATPQQLQALMDGEPRDEAWASQVEWQLENYLALQPFNAALGAPSVRCRSSVCRVIATTSKQTMSRTPEADWHELMAGLRYESVSNEFDHSQESIVFNHSRPGLVGYVTYFTRARPSRNAEQEPQR